MNYDAFITEHDEKDQWKCIPSGSCLHDKASSKSLAVAGSIVKMHSFLYGTQREKGVRIPQGLEAIAQFLT